jgi:hypothetical protein
MSEDAPEKSASAVPEPPQPDTSASADPKKPPRRGWFVVLAWITLILFAGFVAFITISTARIPALREEQGMTPWHDREGLP